METARRNTFIAGEPRRILGHELAGRKCHAGSGREQCKYLTASREGFTCGFVDIVLSVRLAASAARSAAGPCRDPYDAETEAVR